MSENKRKRTEKTVEHEGQSNHNCFARIGPQEPGEGTPGIGNQWENGNPPYYNITEIGMNTDYAVIQITN